MHRFQKRLKAGLMVSNPRQKTVFCSFLLDPGEIISYIKLKYVEKGGNLEKCFINSV